MATSHTHLHLECMGVLLSTNKSYFIYNTLTMFAWLVRFPVACYKYTI